MNEFKPYLSKTGAWALALGASVGWGSMVVTCNTYLVKAGPLGSIIGLLVATAIMLIISSCYHYLMNRYPDEGGAYTYCKEVFGRDHGFITAWFLLLVYIAVFWANATSLPLFARYFIGDTFKFGFSYTVFGYEIFFGEILLTLSAMIVIFFICFSNNKVVQALMIMLVAIFCIGVSVCCIKAYGSYDAGCFSFDPAFVPDKNILFQIIKIACISPWAFIGFENISHSVCEMKFPREKSFFVLAISAISAAIIYILIILLSVSAYPPEYSSWSEYIGNLGNLSGIEALPPFYASRYYFGDAGVVIMMISLLALIFTTMISNVIALTRLLHSVSKDNIISGKYTELSDNGIPRRTFFILFAMSVPVLFLGRTTIGWIVDVTTIGATLVYAFVSAAALKEAKVNGDKKYMALGLSGLIFMVLFGIFLLLPNLISEGDMANESYILFTIWSVLGFWFFRGILKNDKENKFGKSIIVWISLLSLILLTSLIWMNQASIGSANKALVSVKEYYDNSGGDFSGEEEFFEQTLDTMHIDDIKYMSVVVGLFLLSLAMLMTNYNIMSRRAKEMDEELGLMKRTAYRDPLTGVKSKHAFQEKEFEINERIKDGIMEDFAVIVCDVNGLKHINDTMGHKAGDAYICEACSIICRIFDHSPVYRTGGDEFVVVATGGDFEIREQLMADLNRIVEGNISVNKAVVSAGISDFKEHEDSDMHAVFERADALMYERKKQLKSMGAKTRE